MSNSPDIRILATMISGVVVRGDGRGRKIGFPTANLALKPENERPSVGVYAAWATFASDNIKRMSAVHVGPVPTFNKPMPMVEVHILDFPDRDLYDETLLVDIVAKVADVRKFSSVEQLKHGIQESCDAARDMLTKGKS